MPEGDSKIPAETEEEKQAGVFIAASLPIATIIVFLINTFFYGRIKTASYALIHFIKYDSALACMIGLLMAIFGFIIWRALSGRLVSQGKIGRYIQVSATAAPISSIFVGIALFLSPLLVDYFEAGRWDNYRVAVVSSDPDGPGTKAFSALIREIEQEANFRLEFVPVPIARNSFQLGRTLEDLAAENVDVVIIDSPYVLDLDGADSGRIFSPYTIYFSSFPWDDGQVLDAKVIDLHPMPFTIVERMRMAILEERAESVDALVSESWFGMRLRSRLENRSDLPARVVVNDQRTSPSDPEPIGAPLLISDPYAPDALSRPLLNNYDNLIIGTPTIEGRTLNGIEAKRSALFSTDEQKLPVHEILVQHFAAGRPLNTHLSVAAAVSPLRDQYLLQVLDNGKILYPALLEGHYEN